MPAPAAVRSVLLADAPFLPTKLSGLQLWLAADHLALADGAAVATWPDLSGNGFDASQATAGLRPLFTGNVVNGKPAVRFDGVNDHIDCAWASMAQPYTLYIVGAWRTATANTTMVDGVDGTHRADLGLQAGPIYIWYCGSVFNQGSVTATQRVYGLVANGAASEMRFDSVTVTGDAGTHANTGLQFGWSGPNAGLWAPVDIAEVALYTRLLTVPERARLERYLGSKYAIAVAS